MHEGSQRIRPARAVPRAAFAAFALFSIASCCFGGGEGRTVLAQTDLRCGAETAHVRRVDVVLNNLSGTSEVRREVAFGEAVARQAVSGRLGTWRRREELPEHVRSARMTDAGSAWILATPDDVEYRCLSEHLSEIEAVFEADHPLVIFHASERDVVPTFSAERDGVSIVLRLRTDGSLVAEVQRDGAWDGMPIGQMAREASGRVLEIAGNAVFPSDLPPAFADASAMLAVARDERGRTLLERFPAETRLVDGFELPLP